MYVLIFQLLKILNSNTENPYLIWDNATRQQLNEFLLDQQQKMIKTVSLFLILFHKSTSASLHNIVSSDRKLPLRFMKVFESTLKGKPQ